MYDTGVSAFVSFCDRADECDTRCAGAMLKTTTEKTGQQSLPIDWPATTTSRRPGAAICKRKTAPRMPIRSTFAGRKA